MTSTQRLSRFIEGEPLTHSPSVTTQPLFNSIMTEQAEHDQRRRFSSTSPTTSTHSHSPISDSSPEHTNSSNSSSESVAESPSQSLPRVSTSSLRAFVSNGRRNSDEERGRSRSNGGADAGWEGKSVAEKIKGRLRALSGLAGKGKV